MKADSAGVCRFTVIPLASRGSTIAAGSVKPRSSRSSRICRTVVMIVEPPGEPTASSGLPSSRTIVGAIELRGRLPPSTRFGCVRYEVEVRELVVSRKPAARDDEAGAAGRLDRERVRDDVAPAVGGRDVRCRADARLARGWPGRSPPPSLNGYGSPGATGSSPRSSVISARRVAANPSESSPLSGTSK